MTWSESLSLPYSNAIMSERMRIHCGVVPEPGVTLLDGRYIPTGTTISMNLWVVDQRTEYFGPDAESSIPER